MRLQQQKRNISKRVQRRQVHKRRRKRQTTSGAMSPPPIEDVDRQINQFCSQEATKSNVNYQRRRRRRLPPTTTVVKFAWFMLTITQLLCDMAQVESSGRLFGLLASGAEQEASSDLDAASSELAPARPFQVDEIVGHGVRLDHNNNNNNHRHHQQQQQQRFLVEPRDAFAVVGQAEVSFSCLIYAQHGAGSWKRASRSQLSAWNLNILDNGERMWTTLEKFSLLNQQQQQQPSDRNNSAQNGGSPISRPDDEPIATNYTLHIRNVTLANDDHYQCLVAAADVKCQPEIKSRQARLSVVKPPGQLELRWARISANDGTEIDIGGLGQPDTPTWNVNENSITTLVDATNRQQAAAAPVRVVELEEGERLRLECRSGQSKPRTDIVWLDGDSLGPIADETRDQLKLSVETHFELESNQLERTISAVVLEADRDKHHEKTFVCSTRHLAYELAANGSLPESISTSLRPLSQSVKLSVNYKPRVELDKDQNYPVEGSPLRFSCSADARPLPVNFSWFVDEQQIEGARESELFIGSVTRQLHLREVKCVASNSIGSGSAVIRLSVKYSPAYVTHLLPPSLQPDFSSTTASAATTAGHHQQEQQQNARRRNFSKQLIRDSFLGPSDQSVSRELALGVADGADIELRCDFDSNPNPQQIQWLKIASDYSTVSEVTSAEADELIAQGGNGVQFRGRARELHRKRQSPIYYDTVQLEVRPPNPSLLLSNDHHGNKRHIVNEETQDLVTSVLEEDPQNQDQSEPQVSIRSVNSNQPNGRQMDHLPKSYELDFERMSQSLIAELRSFGEQEAENRRRLEEANLNSSTIDLQQPVKRLGTGSSTSQTNIHKIHEPLAFFLHRHHQLANSNQSSSSSGARDFTGQRFSELVLLDRAQDLSESGASATNVNKTTGGLRKRPSVNGKRLSRALSERVAQLTTSKFTLTKVNVDSIGRYVCLAKAADGFQDQARAVFLVLRQSPRIISERRQLAPLGASQLQVECLVQINTVHDNQTRIQWFKDGKLLDSSAGWPRNISTEYEVSPDALYMRSKLTINGAQNSDFGQYTCNISNSLGTDSMQILLQPTASTGFLLKALLYAVAISVALFVLAIAVLLAMTLGKRRPRSITSNGKPAPASTLAILKGGGKKVGVVLATAAAADGQGGGKLASADPRPPPPPPPPQTNSDRASNSPSGHSNQSAAKRSINSSEASTTTAARQMLDVELEAIAQSQRLGVMMMMQNHGQGADQQQQRHQIVRPGSALGYQLDAVDQEQHYSNSMRGRFARTSLRSDRRSLETKLERSRNATLNLAQIPSNRNKFAAIHETLEHKLHFGGAGGAVNLMATPPDNKHEHHHDQGQQQNGDPLPSKSAEDFKQIKSSASFVDKIRNKFKSQAPPNNSRSKHNFDKGRPTISMPNSLTLVSDQNQTRPVASTVSLSGNQQSKHSLKMHLNHISGGVESSLVSSKANLIQDSGTASDGTTSSGRSSITSNNPNGHLHRQTLATHLIGPHQDQAYLVNQMSPVLAQQQQQQELWTKGNSHQAIGQLGASNCDENTLYANSSNFYDLTNDQQQQQQQLYANGYHQQAMDPNSMLGPYGQYQQPQTVVYVTSQLDDLHQQQMMIQETNERYQMPVLMSEPYLAAAAAAAAASAQQQDATRPCYATICNGVNKSPLRQQHQTSHNGYSLDGAAGHGTLPARVHFENHHQQPQHQQPMSMASPIVCSVDEDAAFESHYGTLLSKSSAYKTLGYDQLPQKEAI